MKKISSVILTITLLACIFSGCSKTDPGTAAPDQPSTALSADTSGFQKNMNISSVFRLPNACRTEVGYYLQSEGLLYFLNPESRRMTPVCSRPECQHSDERCNGWVNSLFLSYYKGKLYYANGDSGDKWELYAMNPDGTEHQKIQAIQFESADMMKSYKPMLYNGKVYFIDSDRLYSASLGEDIQKAALLLKEDGSGKLESSWKFWADSDSMYAMNHLLNSAGEYQDVLYQLGTDENSTKEVWRSSQKQIPQQKDSLSSWYISGGQLYYYASGNDLWRIDLKSGEEQKLIVLDDILESGTAVFSESVIVILNDKPDAQWGPQSGYRTGGDTIKIYDYAGKLLNEISLKPIYEKYADVSHCTMVFADENSIYLLAYRGMEHSASNVLYQISQKNGELHEIEDWIGSTVNYQNPDANEKERNAR